MPEDKILVTDLINEVGNQALSIIHCEPFIKWVLGKVPIAIEHDASAILLTESAKPICYLWFNQPLNDDYIRQFKLKSLDALNSATGSSYSEGRLEVLAFNEGEIVAQNFDDTQSPGSFYSTPLVVRGKTMGVFTISSSKPGLFLVYRLNMFNVFANQVALAIDSLKAREQVAKQVRIIERDRANMKNAFAGLSEGLVMTDETDQVILFNPVAKRMLGLRDDEPEILPKDIIVSIFYPLFKELTENNKHVVIREVDLEKPQKMTLRIYATPARDSENKKIGTVILLRDITAEKELDRLKTEFISTVSHELRTPLTTIRESVSQVLDGILGATTPQQREFLSICLEDIDRLTRIINDLLDISKIEAKKVEIRREIVDMVALVKGVGLIFNGRAREKGLEIRTQSPCETAEIYLDKDKIIQVITNLVGNSLKFAEKGYIEISVVDKQDCVECSVFDTGRGIAEEDLPKVFSKFQQFGRTAGPGEKGTGLGLSIARGIVEMHNGKIWVESKLNEWTKFTFVLPRYISEEALLENIEKRISEAKRDHREFSLFLVRIDNLDQIKQEFGQSLAPKVLLKTLETFKKVVRLEDFVTCKSENEIVVLAALDKRSGLELQDRFKAAEQICVLKVNDQELKLKFSYCCSTYPVDADNPKDLFRKVYYGLK
jgi:signal transduction histidine kinase